MSFLRNLLIKITGNCFAQNLLEKNVRKSQLLMGIGSGDDVETSGEDGIAELLFKNKQSNYCIFDVGANQGQYLKSILKKLSGVDYQIHCFEPSSLTFEILKKNAPKDDRIFLNNLALGKEKGEATLYSNETGSGLASLTKRQLDHFNIEFDQAENVSIDTLDGYCQQKGIDRIDLLKLDVEGHEMDVLLGSLKMFKREAIKIVVFEFGGCNIDTRSYFRDFFNFFRDNKMSLFRITPGGYLRQLDSYKEIFEQFRTTNFVAVKKQE